MRSSASAPTMPSRPAYRLAMRPRFLRQASMTPAAVALMTAVTPPDWAYSAFRAPGFVLLRPAIVKSVLRAAPPPRRGAKHSLRPWFDATWRRGQDERPRGAGRA